MTPDSRGLWAASAPPAPVTAALTGTVSADVAVVGAGYTGLSAALHLAQAGASVVVLESAEIGSGGSGRNVGLVNAGLWVQPSVLRQSLGPVDGPRLLNELSNAPTVVFDLIARHGIACEAVRTGTLHCAVGRTGQRDLEERARQWAELGAPVRLLDTQEASRLTGTSAYRGALLDLRAGTIQPLAYAHGLAHAAIAAGARLFSGSPVRAVKDNKTHWQLQTDNGATVHAAKVLVTTNATSEENTWCSPIREELVRLPYFNLATAPLSSALRQSILPECQGAWDTREVLCSFRLDQAGRLIFGSVGALRGQAETIHRAWGHRALLKLFPQLKQVTFEHAWYGWIGMTTNALPRFHRLGRQMYAICGYNGRGIGPGTVFGRALAHLMLGHITEAQMPLPLTPLQSVMARRAREAFYDVGSQLAHVVGARRPP